jgi:TrmH family RNA methyltransferase
MSLLISSTQNPRVKNVLRLRKQRGRNQQERILIDGVRETLRALHSNVEIDDVFVRDAALENESLRQAVADLQRRKIATARLTDEVFERLAYGNRHDGLLAVARPPQNSLEKLRLADDSLILVLEHVEKPGNIGAIARTADAAGVAALLLADPCCDPYNPNAIRASLGTVFLLPVVCDSVERILSWLSGRETRIVTTRVGSPRLYTDVDYRAATALVLGGEAHGLSDLWITAENTAENTPVSLPMLGAGDSLNVAATAAIVCYEAVRQRAIHPSGPQIT